MRFPEWGLFSEAVLFFCEIPVVTESGAIFFTRSGTHFIIEKGGKTIEKTLKNLTLLDRFLFSEAVNDPENMQLMLEIIFGEKVELKYPPQAEKEQKSAPRNRFVKLDVWTEDRKGWIYDTEVQRTNTGNLPRRSRYYQSLIDVNLLRPGETDFNRLKDVALILIAPFDLFGKGWYCYSFQMNCRREPGIVLGDGATRIFLNTHGKDPENITPELRELLHYMEHTNEEREYQSARVRKLRENIKAIQASEEVNVRYMQAWEERAIEIQEAKEEGRREAREEAKTEVKVWMVHRLAEKGMSVEMIASVIDEKPEEVERHLREKAPVG